MGLMSADLFSAVDNLVPNDNSGSTLEFLITQFLEQKNYAMLFETRLMKRRMELGLPLIQTESAAAFAPDKQRAYEETVIEAARQVGTLFLNEGNVERAWPYFRAIGETKPIVDAINAIEPSDSDDLEPIIEIAYQQGASPVKGLELILRKYGMCRAITAFGMYGVASGRDQCIDLLVRSLHSEVVENLKFAIEKRDGTRPESDSIYELLAGRDDMFGEYDYYVDTSHLTSVIQYCPDATNLETLALIRELTHYGKHLHINFRVYGNPPFENIYTDYAAYADALLGNDIEGALEHFRDKVRTSEPGETLAVQTLVQLLIRLKRLPEAAELAIEHLSNKGPSELMCPPPMQICHMAGDYQRLMELAKQRGDVLSYAAAAMERGGKASVSNW